MKYKLFIILITLVFNNSAFSQQLTREIVDNMNRMCGTGQTVNEGLETNINLLKRLGIVGVENKRNEREIATIIDSIKDERIKIEALRAIQSCNLEYLRTQGKRSDQRKDCIKLAEKEKKQQKPIAAVEGVRCEGGGIRGDSDYQVRTVSVNAPAGFIITGPAAITINSESRGSVGSITYTIKNGYNVAASAQISCRSPDKTFGPGAFVNVTLSATVERILSTEDIRNIENSCNT